MKYCCLFRLEGSTTSKSTKISFPTPMRANAMAMADPSPPNPAIPTVNILIFNGEESAGGGDERLFFIDLNPNCFWNRLFHKTRLMNKNRNVKNRFPLTFQKVNVINF